MSRIVSKEFFFVDKRLLETIDIIAIKAPAAPTNRVAAAGIRVGYCKKILTIPLVFNYIGSYSSL